MKWKWSAKTAPLPSQEELERFFPVLKPALPIPAAPQGTVQATWAGHSSFVLSFENGQKVLTDPVWDERCSPSQWFGPKRIRPLPFEVEEVGSVDFVVISHNHYDHLSLDTLRRLSKLSRPPIVLVPLGLKAWVDKNTGLEAVELDWFDGVQLGSLRFDCTPVQHWSNRGTDRNETLWSSWVITDTSSGARVFFTGDTGMPDCDMFGDIGRFFPNIHLALIPIGAYAPRWFMKEQHIDPAEAVAIKKALGAKRAIGMHFGTFVLTDEDVREPVWELEKALKDQAMKPAEFVVPRHGETIEIRID
jgi:N-acyl-phosphatidylethanolamine-hydrolysing phospholipase D